MSPTDASVYSDQWSATTWSLILLTIVLGVIALMTLFLAMVHRSTEQMTAHGQRVRAATAPDPLAREMSTGTADAPEVAPAPMTPTAA